MATHSIGTGGDFSTVQAWEDDIPSILTEARIGQVKNEELVVSGQIVDFEAHVTTSSFNIILEAQAGASFKDNANVRTNALGYNAANGAALRNNANVSNVINFSGIVPDCIIRNLQVKHDGTGGYRAVLSNNATTGLVLRDMIFEASQNSDNRGMIETIGTTFINCLLIQRGTAGYGSLHAGGASANTFLGCTIVRPSNITAYGTGISPTYTGDVVKSCVVAGFTVDYETKGSGTTNTDYNATDLSDVASGFPDPASDHNVYSMPFTTSTFVQPSDASGLHDFRVVAGSVVENAGFYDGTNAPSDISGLARSNPPEVGAWELASAVTKFWFFGPR